jgi:heme-degrading monooxygenase HmoA
MYVQVVNFNLKDTTEQEYRAVCEQEAPLFSAIPGLVAKYWLADPETNTYGGVYLWESRAALDAYLHGEIWAAAQADPSLTNITSRAYGILAAPTRVTRGLPEVALAP